MGTNNLIEFRKKEESFIFNDNQGNTIERKTEIRLDPLTGETARILLNPGLSLTPPDLTEEAKRTEGANCPFCKENLLKMTPVFPDNIANEGRIFQGKAVVFPNLFPYCKHNGVTIFSEQHYVRLEEFTLDLLKDAFVAAHTYIKKVVSTDPKGSYISINWNYLPNSGGSIIHPHIQVMVSESPTNYQSIIAEKTEEFQKINGKGFFSSLSKLEKQLGERWIGEYGNIAWMTAFAPKGHNDFLAVFSDAYSVHDLHEEDWLHFARGLQCVFAAMTEQGFASFNLALHFSSKTKEPIHARLIPRLTFGALQTSDYNVFHALHQEPLSYYSPEEVARKARVHFTNTK